MKFKVMLLPTLLGLNLVACTPKVDVSPSAGGPANPDLTFANKVSGPNLDGLWVSGCIPGPFGGNTRRKVQLKIEGGKFEHSELSYEDSSCAGAGTKKDLKGLFRFTKDWGDNSFTIEYKIAINSNVSTWQFRGLRLTTEGKLRLSDPRMDENETGKFPLLIELTKASGADKKSGDTNANAILEAGTYRSEDQKMFRCDQTASTSKSGGEMLGLWLQINDPCENNSFQLGCNHGKCQSVDGADLYVTVLDSQSYELYQPSTEKHAVFRKK